jgi:hypothetical protein
VKNYFACKKLLTVTLGALNKRDPIPDFRARVRYEKLKLKKAVPQAHGQVLK